jgi:two-component system sensor histidine kinase TctE
MGALLSRLRTRLLLRLLMPLGGLIVLDALLAYRAQQHLSEGLLSEADGSTWTALLQTLLPHLIILVTLAVAAWRAVDAALRPLLDLVAGQAEHQRRFIADAAHQLRTPLAALQSQVEAWAQAARRIVPPGTTGSLLVPVDQIDKLCSATRRTTQLANQLLALSRAEARTTTDQAPEPVDLKALSESVLEAYLDKALTKRIDLGLEVEPVTVAGHAWLLREYLANVVDNAVKYTPTGGTVTIRGGPVAAHAGSGAGGHPSGAFLTVEDDGPGVPEQDLPRVLDRFYRVPGSAAEGTGLGLAIADEIARVHRARLVLGQGIGGRGLSVTLIFPGKNRR